MYLLGKVQPQVTRTWSWKVTSEIAFHFLIILKREDHMSSMDGMELTGYECEKAVRPAMNHKR